MGTRINHPIVPKFSQSLQFRRLHPSKAGRLAKSKQYIPITRSWRTLKLSFAQASKSETNDDSEDDHAEIEMNTSFHCHNLFCFIGILHHCRLLTTQNQSCHQSKLTSTRDFFDRFFQQQEQISLQSKRNHDKHWDNKPGNPRFCRG